MAAIRMMLDINSLDLDIKEKAARTAYRLKCSNEWVDNGIGHTTILREIPKGAALEAPQDKMDRYLQFGQRYTIKIPSREQWENDQVLGHGDIWFTDGSKTGQSTGFGIYGSKRKYDSAYRLREYNTVFQAEMAAMETCCRKLVQDNVRGRCIRICTDSQASIMALDNPSTKSNLVREAKRTLNELSKENEVIITWIPGHTGYTGNERADRLAKQGAREGTQPEWDVGVPYQEGCNTIRRSMEQEKRRRWESSEKYRWSKGLLGEHISSWANVIPQLSRRKAKEFLGILTGHCNLRCYTHKTEGQSNLCRWCEKEEETPDHFLCKCPNLMGYRHKWLGSGFIDSEILKGVGVDSILAYCKALGLTEKSGE